MDWAYLNFGPKLNLGFNQSPKPKLNPLINSIKWAKGILVISPLCRLALQVNGILVIPLNFKGILVIGQKSQNSIWLPLGILVNRPNFTGILVFYRTSSKSL